MIPYDLGDCDTPEKVPVILANAAEAFRDSAAELQGAWQDQNAGKVWADFATILDRAAESCRKAIAKRLG